MENKRRVSPEERERMVAEAAYYRSLERGFENGDPVEDWIYAERLIDARFALSPHDRKLEQLYAQLAEANQRVREVVADLRDEAREEWNEEVERLHELREAFAAKLEEVREHTGQAKQRAKRQADRLWKDLIGAIERMGTYR